MGAPPSSPLATPLSRRRHDATVANDIQSLTYGSERREEADDEGAFRRKTAKQLTCCFRLKHNS